MEDRNFYRAPEAPIIAPPTETLAVVPATKLRRFINWLIDYVVVYGLVFLLAMVCALLGWMPVVDWMTNLIWWQDQLFTALLLVAYYTILEGLFGCTPGKLVTGTRVVDGQGRRITFGCAALRSVCRCIPFNGFSLLLSDKDVRRGWHDRLSKTYVVRRRQPVALMAASDELSLDTATTATPHAPGIHHSSNAPNTMR